jgi:hypothetical protein
VGSGLIATLAVVDQSATWQATQAMPQTSGLHLHEELMTSLFPRSANVLTVDQWIAALPAPNRR